MSEITTITFDGDNLQTVRDARHNRAVHAVCNGRQLRLVPSPSKQAAADT